MAVMTSEDGTLALLERALGQTADVIAAIRPDQAGLATPCPDWDVRELVRHVAGQGLSNFLVRARGETADWQAPTGELGDDWAAEFRSRADELMAVWRAADLGRPVAVPGGGQAPLRNRADQQITELAVHGWDLARATGQRAELDPAVAEHALGWSRQMLRPEFRGPGKAVGAEVPVSPDAPAYQRLAGWFGRDPGWTPPSAAAGA
ncbi:MAG: TIGR03086 family protein [Actinobacteria bacterium]|nr:TIGR03086 family protein [Actinomycetota bacterium]MBO0788550.1 TIGR03086 family protein [Actinomycetota bacterium]MBO0816071.1 TIGR03086 family protein [Actinomycetota bacterium]